MERNGRAGSGRRRCGAVGTREGRESGVHQTAGGTGFPQPGVHRAGAERRASAGFAIAWPANSLNEI